MTGYAISIITGLTTGSLFALIALGLVLTYKTSGVFNFGHGAVAAVGAYVFYEAHTRHHLAWPLALLVAVVVFGPVAGVLMELVARRMARVSTAQRIVGTVGILIAVQAGASLRYGAEPKTVAPFLPSRSFRIASVNVGADQMIIAAIGVVGATGLYLLLRSTRVGRAMRAVVDDPSLLDLTGISPVRVRRVSWAIGCAFAALSGALISPILNLDPTLLTLLVVQAFGAAAIGSFSSLPMTYAGGLIVGVAQTLVEKWSASTPSLSSLYTAVPFLILFLALLVVPRRRLALFGSASTPGVRPRPMPPNLRWALTGAGLIVAVSIPFVVGSHLPLWNATLAEGLVFLSLSFLVRTSGQVSLCHVGFAAIGAAAFGHLAGNDHWPWLVALLAAGALTVPAGALIAIPAIRLSGIFLALATFGFGLLLSYVGYSTSLMFGGTGASLTAPRPGVLGLQSDRSYYFLLLAILAVAAAIIVSLERSRLGRLLRGIAESPNALTTHGANVNVTRTIVFCISAGLAGIGGALFASLSGQVNGDDFQALSSLVVLVVLVIVASFGTVGAALAGSGLLFCLPGYINNANTSEWLSLGFGVAAVVSGLAIGLPGLPEQGVRPTATRRRAPLRSPVAARRALLTTKNL